MPSVIDADVMILENVLNCGLSNFEYLQLQSDAKNIVFVISYGRVMIFVIRLWTQLWWIIEIKHTFRALVFIFARN